MVQVVEGIFIAFRALMPVRLALFVVTFGPLAFNEIRQALASIAGL